jgi:hypothetical protein
MMPQTLSANGRRNKLDFLEPECPGWGVEAASVDDIPM